MESLIFIDEHMTRCDHYSTTKAVSMMVSSHSLDFLVAHMVPGVLEVLDLPWVLASQLFHQLLEDQESP